MPPRRSKVLLASAALVVLSPWGRADDPKALLGFVVRAGRHDRREALLRLAIPADRLAGAANPAAADGPMSLRVVDPLAPPGHGSSPAEADRQSDGTIRLTFVLPRPLRAGEEGRFEVVAAAKGADPIPWATDEGSGGRVEFRLHDRPAFTYNARPLASPLPGASPRLTRDAYIHPAFTPAGVAVTGDFSKFHPHHRGLFLAYTKTRWGEHTPDFWNIQDGKGRIVADGVEAREVGPVAARLVAGHRWEAATRSEDGKTSWAVALRERWEVEAYDVPGLAGRLIDLTSTQRAVTHPLELIPYRYGGMAYRSAEPSVKGPLDVLTAEGRHRVDGDGKPTRWVDLTGPVADGSPNYAGAMIVDHPANPNQPTVARIHPTTLPFFSFVPGHDRPLTIPTDRGVTFRYRILIHDGRPDPSLNSRIAADFAEPPEVTLD